MEGPVVVTEAEAVYAVQSLAAAIVVALLLAVLLIGIRIAFGE